jgi:hypothetical protein
MPGQPSVCLLGDVPVNGALLDCVNVCGIDPGKHNIITMDTGSKLKGEEYYRALRAAPTDGHVNKKQTAMLDAVKAAEAYRSVHHFRVLTSEALWEAVRVAQATATALTKQYARPACMKRGLTLYSRVQQRTKAIVDMIQAGTNASKPIVIALGRNYKGARARCGDKWTPVCKAVLDMLARKFTVVLIDEYLTSQMCHSCHNKLVPRKGENREKHCAHCGCDVDRDVNAAKNMLEVFLFHVRGWGRPEYLCRPNQHAALPQGVPAPQPQTADV